MSMIDAADAQDSFVVMGQQFTIRVTPAQTDGACFAFDLIAEPGLGVPTHVHANEDEVFHIRRGWAKFVMGGRATVVGPGGTAFGPRGVSHAWEAVGDEPLDAIVIVTPGNLEAMFRALAELTTIDFPRIAAICAPHGVQFV